MTKALCCCTVGQGWVDPDDRDGHSDRSSQEVCTACPQEGTGQ